MAKTKNNEDGFTKIPNAVLDELVAYRVPGEEMKCLLFIIRKTWGWHKKSDSISLSQFHKATKMKKPSIIKALRRLELKKLIIVSQNANKKGKTYRFNKKFKTWIKTPKKSAGKVLAKKLTEVSKKANENVKIVSQSATHKRNIIKEKKERENPAVGFKKEPTEGFLANNKRRRSKTLSYEDKRKEQERQKEALRPYVEQEILSRLETSRQNPDEMPTSGTCAVCQCEKRLAWNDYGFNICRECVSEGWLNKAATADSADVSTIERGN